MASSDHAAGAVEPDDVARGQQKDTTTLADEEELRLGEEEGARGPITVISGRHGRMAPPPPGLHRGRVSLFPLLPDMACVLPVFVAEGFMMLT